MLTRRGWFFGLIPALAFLATVCFAADEAPILRIDPGGHTAQARSVLFTPDGRQVISVGLDKSIRLWNLETGDKRVLRYEIGPGVDGQAFAAAVSPDEKTPRLAVAVRADGLNDDILLFDYVSGQQTGRLTGHKGFITGVAFSRDGSLLASCGTDGTVRLWDMASGKERHIWKQEDRTYIASVAFSPDGAQLAASGWRQADNGGFDGLVSIWNTQNYKGAASQRWSSAIMCVAWSSSGALAYGSRDGVIHLWNQGKDTKPITFPAQRDTILTLAFSPDGSQLLSAGGEKGFDPAVRVWSVPDGRSLAEFDGHQATVFSVAFSPDGKRAASGDAFGSVYVWDPATGHEERDFRGTGRSAFSVAWSPDATQVAWGTNYKTNALENAFDLAHASPVPQFNAADKWIASQSEQNGLSLTLLPDFSAIVIRNAQNKEVNRIPAASGDQLRCFTFLSDGEVMVGSDQYLALWNVSGKPRLECLFEGHEGPVMAVSVSPKDRYLASASADQTIRVWSLSEKDRRSVAGNKVVTPLCSVFQGDDGQWIEWTPQGYYAASPAGDDIIGWQVNQGRDKAAEVSVVATQFRQRFYRPDALRHVLQTGDVIEALKVADAEKGAKNEPGVTLTDQIAKLPRVDILNVGDAAPRPDGVYVVNGGTATVQARVTNADPATIKWSVANQTHRLDDQKTRELFLTDEKADEKKLKLPLESGLNDFYISVTNDAGESSPKHIRIEAHPTDDPNRKPSLYLISVGVKTFADSHIPPLEYTDDDAKAVADFYEGQKSKLFGDVHITTLMDKEATGPKLLDTLKGLKGQVKPGDTVILFIASHGVNEATRGVNAGAGERDVRVALFDTSLGPDFDKTAVQGQAIVDLLNDLPINVNTLLILDICHAHTITYAILNDFLRSTRSKMCALTACGPDESSQEDSEWKHGLFTYALLEALNGKAALADDNSVSLLRAAAYVVDRVHERIKAMHYPNSQTPQLLPLPNANSSFPIAQTK